MSFLDKVNDIHVHLGPSSIINQKLYADDLLDFRKNYNIDHIGLMTLDVDIDKNNLKIIELSKTHNFIHGLFWIQKSNSCAKQFRLRNCFINRMKITASAIQR